MTNAKLIAAALLAACSIASAQDVVLIGHVQRVILQPSGAENCPPTCPAVATVGADGPREICISKYIVNLENEPYHRARIDIGTKGAFVEGPGKVAVCEVIAIHGLANDGRR